MPESVDILCKVKFPSFKSLPEYLIIRYTNVSYVSNTIVQISFSKNILCGTSITFKEKWPVYHIQFIAIYSLTFLPWIALMPSQKDCFNTADSKAVH